MVASDYAPTVGGVQTAVRNIAHHSARFGNCVTILSALPRGDVPTVEEVDGIVVHRFPWGRRPFWTLPFRGAWTLVRMARVLREFKPDLVYIHFLSINAFYILLLHYLRPFKLVVSARGNDIQGIPQRSRVQRWMLPRLFRRADAILFCSSFVRRDATQFLPDVSSRNSTKGVRMRVPAFVGVVGDGVNPEDFEGHAAFVHPARDRGIGDPVPYLLAMGRLVEKKGFDLLIRAFALVAPDFPRVHLLIAGDGEEWLHLERMVDELKMRERITLPGLADRDEGIALFLGCEFFVLSSRVEPFGIVVLEAMAAHKAVLATKSGGVIDLIQPGVNGLLVEPEIGALANGMREMLAHPEATRAMGERAQATIQDHTWARVTRQFLDVFELVLESKT